MSSESVSSELDTPSPAATAPVRSTGAVVAAVVLLVALAATAAWLIRGQLANDSPIQAQEWVPLPPKECIPGESSDILVPNCGAWIGSTDRRNDNLDLAVQEQILGETIDLVRLYAVGPDATFFPVEHQTLADGGRTLVYSWKVSTDNAAGPVWRRVASGEFDNELRRAANEIVASGHPVLFSLHHEPEDDSETLGGSYGTDADYRAMLRHAHEIMEPIGGDQLIWFVNYMGHSFGSFDQVEAMYPGDDMLDWVSWNPYNWFGCHGDAPWKGFAEQAAPFYDWARTNHPDMPLMIGETATNEDPADPQAKAEWILDMGTTLQAEMPHIRAVLWFQQSTDTGFCERRWDSSAPSTDAFAELAASEYFSPR